VRDEVRHREVRETRRRTLAVLKAFCDQLKTRDRPEVGDIEVGNEKPVVRQNRLEEQLRFVAGVAIREDVAGSRAPGPFESFAGSSDEDGTDAFEELQSTAVTATMTPKAADVMTELRACFFRFI
jgi:hypothetical protein